MLPTILLLNPNSSAATTDRMGAVARPHLPDGIALRGATAVRGPAMIVDEAALAASADEVVRTGEAEGTGVAAVIVAAFGDPGAARLRALLPVPVIGIGEASLRAAAAGGRRFGIATTTPGLLRAIAAMVAAHGLAASFTGCRVPDDDPLALAADPDRQADALARATEACLADGADAVVIGGGPLSGTAARLGARFGSLLVEPVPAAIRAAVAALRAGPS